MTLPVNHSKEFPYCPSNTGKTEGRKDWFTSTLSTSMFSVVPINPLKFPFPYKILPPRLSIFLEPKDHCHSTTRLSGWRSEVNALSLPLRKQSRRQNVSSQLGLIILTTFDISFSTCFPLYMFLYLYLRVTVLRQLRGG